MIPLLSSRNAARIFLCVVLPGRANKSSVGTAGIRGISYPVIVPYLLCFSLHRALNNKHYKGEALRPR